MSRVWKMTRAVCPLPCAGTATDDSATILKDAVRQENRDKALGPTVDRTRPGVVAVLRLPVAMKHIATGKLECARYFVGRLGGRQSWALGAVARIGIEM